MKITAIIPETKSDHKRFLLEATGEELDAIRGAAGTVQVADRYRVGYEMKPAETFKVTSGLDKSLGKLRTLPEEIRKIAEAAQAVVEMMDGEK